MNTIKKTFFVAFQAVVSLSAPLYAQSLPQYVPSNGIVGWWPFNGNANDESGNNNNCTINGPVLTTDRFGSVNSAFSFDGINDFLSDATNNLPTGNSDLSISAWFNSTQYPGATSSAICAWGQWTTNNIRYIGLRGATSTPTLTYAQYLTDYNIPYNYSLNTWTHFAVTYTNGAVKCYVNGTLIGSGNVSAANTISGGYYIGRAIASQDYFKGKIDDIGVWDRALTPSEITDLYNSCKLSVSSDPGNVNTSAGSTAQFTVGSSDSTSSYQWQINTGNGFQNLNDSGQFSGTNTKTLSISSIALANNNYTFRCILSLGSCKDTSNAGTLSVSCNLSVTAHPANQTVNAGNSASFSVFTSDSNVSYQWQVNDVSGFLNLTNTAQFSGTNQPTLTITNVNSTNNNKLFRCIVNLVDCYDTSDVALLTINQPNNVTEPSLTLPSFHVYPNPVSEYLYLETDDHFIDKPYCITDVSGKTVLSGLITQRKMSIHLKQVPAGVYFIYINRSVKLIVR